MKSLHASFSLRIFLASLFCSFSFFSCEDDPATSDFWAPGIIVLQGSQQATILTYDPTLLALYAGPALGHPDFFNVMISEDQQNFTFYKRVDYSEDKVLVEDLINGKPYYFKVTAQQGNKSRDSKIVMTIPSEPISFEAYPTGQTEAMRLSTSYDMSYVAITDNGTTYILPAGETAPMLSEVSGGGVSWSSETNMAVYVSDEKVGNTLYPSRLKLFDPASGPPTELLQIPYDQFFVFNPAFIPGSDDISFFSSENNASITLYDIWKINPETKERSRVSNLAASGFILYANYDWSSSSDLLYVDALETTTSPASIFAFNTLTGVKTAVIKSQWNDQRPSVSPDDKTIAFISSRSGYDEIWLYNLETNTYRQVTGSEEFRFDSRYSNLQWISSNQMLVTILVDDNWQAVTLNLN